MSRPSATTVLVAMFAVTTACACGGGNYGSCDRFEFESGISTLVRRDVVGVMDATLEFGAPRRVHRMKLELGNLDTSGMLQGIYLASYFRPIEFGDTPCEYAAGSVETICYMWLESKPLQLQIRFETRANVDYPAIAQDVARAVEAAAFNCN